jgi:hypothetical protein
VMARTCARVFIATFIQNIFYVSQPSHTGCEEEPIYFYHTDKPILWVSETVISYPVASATYTWLLYPPAARFTGFSDYPVEYYGLVYPTAEHRTLSAIDSQPMHIITRYLRSLSSVQIHAHRTRTCGAYPETAHPPHGSTRGKDRGTSTARRLAGRQCRYHGQGTVHKVFPASFPPPRTNKHWLSRTRRRQPGMCPIEFRVLASVAEHGHQIDSFWGIGSDGQGRNELGKALMRLREQLQARRR